MKPSLNEKLRLASSLFGSQTAAPQSPLSSATGGGTPSGGGSCDCDVEGAIARHNADEDAHQDIRDRIEEVAASGGSGGTGFFTLEVDGEGNLYAVYDDGSDPPSFELDSEGNLYYVIEE